MDKGTIEADARHTLRRMKAAMHGNAIRAMVELITNSDDSYTRLEEKGVDTIGKIEIIYEKEGYDGVFSVRDFAEGMTLEDLEKGFKKYGAATSGLKEGKKVRGYFGQGAKDALINMTDGSIVTFCNGNYAVCKIYIENNMPTYEIHGPFSATEQIRMKYSIPANGTLVSFRVDCNKGRVPQFKSVHEELSNNFLLRKILSNKNRKVTLIELETKKVRPITYLPPAGKEVMSENFTITYSNYAGFNIFISIWRSEKELTQTRDDRQGGLLITDENDCVLGISLFKYDNEPLASRLFGDLKIDRFRELLENEEAVLDEERTGLVPRHPFSLMLIEEIEKRIEEQVNIEKRRKQQELQAKLSHEEASRYKKAFSLLNEIADFEAQPVTNLGQNFTDNVENPPNGIKFYPLSAEITPNKRYAFELRLDTKIIRQGSKIELKISNTKIKLTPTEVQITNDEADKIVRKYVTVEATEANIEGTLIAKVGNNIAVAAITVVPEKELLLSEGMIFLPESLTLRPNQTRCVNLLVYTKIIESGSVVKLKSDNSSISFSEKEILVNDYNAERHVVKYEIEIWGEGVGQEAMISAECGGFIALLQVSIKSKEDSKKSGLGMFSEPEFDQDPDPLQRCSYSHETGKITIYANFPTIQHYLGPDCRYRKSLPAQILIADIVSEKCFFEIARKKSENMVLINPDGAFERIQGLTYELSKKYGKKVHQALVDQSLFQKSLQDENN